MRYHRFKFDHLAGCADLPLTTAGNLQTLVNAQSARVVNLESAGTGSGPSTLFIDDARYNIDAAQALGWTGIRFDNSAQVRQDLLLIMGAL